MEPIASDLLQNETNSVLSSQSAAAPPPGINDALPPELLLSVFDYVYIEMTQPLSYPHTMSEAVERSKRHALLDAMLVCRAWHDLVAGSPRYWTTIDVGIRESLGIWPRGAETLGYGEAQRTFLKQQLAGSGELPIQVNVSMAHVDDRTATFDLLRNQAHRWQVFNLLTKHDKGISEPIGQNQLESLFNLPLPCLKSLHVDRCWVKAATGGPIAVSLQVDAPRLRALSCEFHLAIPRSTSHLRFLSITDVHLEKLQPSVDGLKVELDQLVELRITACNPGAILSAFSTPTLSKLIVSSNDANISAPQSLPQYQHLKELQWYDLGPDETFSMFLPLCPNLTFFADYVVGLEENLPLEAIDQPPTVLLEIPNIRLLRGKEERLWPGMTEVLLDSATCTEIAELVDAVPSIQRIRVLRDPTTRGDPENRTNEVRLLGKLQERVNVALWLEPWSDSKGSTDCGSCRVDLVGASPVL